MRRLMQTSRSLGGKQLLLRCFLGGKKLLLLREFLEMQVSWMSIGECALAQRIRGDAGVVDEHRRMQPFGPIRVLSSPANFGGHVEGYRRVVAAVRAG
jgi:hypothetical protein